MTSPLMRRRIMMILGSGAVLGALAGAVYVLAGHGTGTVASYTGCLNPAGGTVYSLAPGETPLKECNTGHPLIHLSGGDITGVAAGAGLSGGGAQGAVSLAVDSTEVQSRVSGDCDFPGGAISKIDEGGTVVCSSGPSVIHTFTAGPFDVANEVGGPVGSLPLPAGTYLVIAKLFLKATDPLAPGEDYINTTCSLHPSDDPFNRDEAVFAGDIDFEAGGTLTMVHAFALSAPGSADVTCRDFGNTLLVADTEWNDLRITAFRVGSLVVEP